MELTDIFRLANLAVGATMVVAGILKIIFHQYTFMEYIVAAYIIIFGAATALLEFQIPPYIHRYASFYFSFLGRGVFYIFVGSIALGNNIGSYLTGGVTLLVGIAYVVLEFMPQIEPPANMQSPDSGWGGEQV